MNQNGSLFLVALLAVCSCGRYESSSAQQHTPLPDKATERIKPVGVECNVEFKNAQSLFKVGQAYRVKLTTTVIDPADVVLASTNGATTNYEAEVDGYNYVVTASRPGLVKLLVFHRDEVGENPLCTVEYTFE